MNEKGFLGFILIFLMCTLILFFMIQMNKNSEELTKTTNELIKAEMSNKERTIIENNTDRIIETKLNEQLLIQNFNTQTAKNSINSKLSEYLRKNAKIYSFNGEAGTISLNFLNQNSSVQILKSEYYLYAEYFYSTNSISTNIKQIFGDKIKSEFLFPQGYTKTIMRAI